MPRKAAVSDDQLREAIAAIVDQGESPTVKRVWGYLRARPGQYASGSNTVTISRVLREWRQGITQLPTPTAAKPSAEGEESARKVTALADRLRRGFTKILKADRAATETRLEALTDQVAELTARLEAEKAARAQAEERAGQLAEELAKLKAGLVPGQRLLYTPGYYAKISK